MIAAVTIMSRFAAIINVFDANLKEHYLHYYLIANLNSQLNSMFVQYFEAQICLYCCYFLLSHFSHCRQQYFLVEFIIAADFTKVEREAKIV